MSEIAALRARVEELEEELRQYRDTFFTDDEIDNIRDHTGMAPIEAKVFALLLRRDRVNREQIYMALYGTDNAVEPRIVDVILCRLRKKHSLPIRTLWKSGWSLADRDFYRAYLERKPA